MNALDAASFDALFDSFRASAVRLETLAAYSVGGAEGERIAAFRNGRPRPERSVRTDPWLARIALGTVQHGKRWTRVRVFDDPPTEYQRYQLESYREAQAVGDEVVIASRSVVGEVGPDVWLFDAALSGAHAVVMHYRPDGSVQGREHVTEEVRVADLAAEVTRVQASAMPLNIWLAADVVRA